MARLRSVLESLLELWELERPWAAVVLVGLADEELGAVLIFPFPFCVGVALAGVVITEVDKVDLDAVDVWDSGQHCVRSKDTA
jgi:hypothetical protein